MLMQCCKSHVLFKLPSSLPNFPSTRKVVDVIQVSRDEFTNSNVKRALLVAQKKDRIKLPLYENANAGEMYHISQFLKHPSGVEAMLNINALGGYVLLDCNTYRCKVPPIQLLNFEVAPVLDLEVSPANDCCTVELLSCKFEGSQMVEDQNKYFSATMTNSITWDDTDSESFLDVDVKLNITLEVVNSYPPISLNGKCTIYDIFVKHYSLRSVDYVYQ